MPGPGRDDRAHLPVPPVHPLLRRRPHEVRHLALRVEPVHDPVAPVLIVVVRSGHVYRVGGADCEQADYQTLRQPQRDWRPVPAFVPAERRRVEPVRGRSPVLQV